ncbi:Myb-like DNA-binding domain protein [Paecilomyces variotii No. 5]|uniref:Myb-like DNA-binding domain protein n=1 Tax=Byssochlamys spectabilis (strain No. 5 / NBRC 109023) TaxID=1356009 RepID=V5G006_BYSSN|nr:Myb-like DNA-binding domain protein [Paecilomyces variotii No. 5]
MERPFKRPRLSPPEDSEQFPDDFDVQEARAQNDLRLKSVFESIFEKYGRDFTDVGDEIDLQTGEIIVNNGHLSNLEREDDLGQNDGPESHSEHPLSPVSSSLDFLPNDQEHGLDNASDELGGISKAGVGPSVETGHHQGGWTQANLSTEQNTPDSAFCEVDEPGSDDDRESVDSFIQHIKARGNGPAGKSSMLSHKEAAALTEVTNLPENKSPLQTSDTGKQKQIIDPIWQVPEIESKFLTPTTRKQAPRTPMLQKRARSASPPGAGSLWALPTPGRKRNTDVAKKSKKVVDLNKPKRRRISKPKKKDWSFAVVADASDSDDPLQEDYQKTPIRAPSVTRRSGSALSETQIENDGFVDESFTLAEPTEELDDSPPRGSVSGLHEPEDEQSLNLEPSGLLAPKPRESPKEIQEPEQPEQSEEPEESEEPEDPGEPEEPEESQESEGPRECISLNPKDTGILQSFGETRIRVKSQSPVKDIHGSSKTPITPDEAKVIIKMRHIDGSSWKEIAAAIPGRTAFQITQWNHMHWQNRKLNPPRSSKPWSSEDRKKLARFADEDEMTWSGLQKEFPGHTRAEIEFELLCVWAHTTETVHDGERQAIESHDGNSTLPPVTTSEKSPDKGNRVLVPTQDGPSTPRKQERNSSKRPNRAYLDFEDLIETGSMADDSDGLQTSGLSSIQLEARENGNSSARFKRSPSKSLVSPLAKRSSLSSSRRSVLF